MMSKKKQYIVLTILTLVLGLLFFPSRIFAASYDTAFSTISSSLLDTSSSIEDTKDIVEAYCSAVFSSDSFIENEFVYTAKQSAFVYLLCKEADEY
jgi:hypothetical protein